MMIGILINKTK